MTKNKLVSVVVFIAISVVVWLQLRDHGSGGKIDKGKAERSLRSTLSKWPVKEVRCPADVALRKGDVFVCHIGLGDGQTFDARMVQTNDKGNVELEPIAGTKVADVAALISEQVGQPVTIECGGKAVLLRANGPADCTAKSDTEVRAFQVTFDGDRWNASWK